MKLTALLLAVPLLAACGRASRPPVSTAPSVADAAPPAVVDPEVELAALRAEGPAALARLLAEYDQVSAPSTRDRLAARIDRVAGQRYATLSRLYWYTDLAQAQAAARAAGKPILSLRMLGRLDEDLSCANSRMFRTLLYPDREVSKLLRERFVLHWSSERPAPRVTVDYGDGRTLATTVTGNSAHYVLDADGRVLDVLPGMYAPAVFRGELARVADQAAAVRTLAGSDWRAAMQRYHGAQARRAATQWASVRNRILVDGKPATGAEVEAAAALAQRATISKAYVEVPVITVLDLGVDPGALPDPTARAAAATTIWKLTEAKLLDPAATRLVESLLPVDADRGAVFARLTRGILAETTLDDLSLRPRIRARLQAEPELGFAELNRFVYADVFSTPASDPWMGLLSRDTYSGLPGGAVITRR